MDGLYLLEYERFNNDSFLSLRDFVPTNEMGKNDYGAGYVLSTYIVNMLKKVTFKFPDFKSNDDEYKDYQPNDNLRIIDDPIVSGGFIHLSGGFDNPPSNDVYYPCVMYSIDFTNSNEENLNGSYTRTAGGGLIFNGYRSWRKAPYSSGNQTGLKLFKQTYMDFPDDYFWVIGNIGENSSSYCPPEVIFYSSTENSDNIKYFAHAGTDYGDGNLNITPPEQCNWKKVTQNCFDYSSLPTIDVEITRYGYLTD